MKQQVTNFGRFYAALRALDIIGDRDEVKESLVWQYTGGTHREPAGDDAGGIRAVLPRARAPERPPGAAAEGTERHPQADAVDWYRHHRLGEGECLLPRPADCRQGVRPYRGRGASRPPPEAPQHRGERGPGQTPRSGKAPGGNHPDVPRRGGIENR